MKASCVPKEVIEDETFFMQILIQVDNYYIYHPTCVTNEEIGEFCGPQCHSDRFNLDKFHFFRQNKIL